MLPLASNPLAARRVPRARRFWVVVLLAMAGLALLAAFDPARTPIFPRCAIYALTGLLCPGCGGQRALHALLHGHVAEAIRYNALLPLAVVLGVGFAWRPPARPPGGYLHARWVWGFVALVVAFVVVRNTGVVPLLTLP